MAQYKYPVYIYYGPKYVTTVEGQGPTREDAAVALGAWLEKTGVDECRWKDYHACPERP